MRPNREDPLSKIVLCVDDSATMQMVADITFRGTEFTYQSARSVEEALDKAKSHKPAVVLADAQMPGKNGYDLCLAIKNDAKLGDVPVVILVGNGAPYDSARGVTVGADANLPKPWDTQAMLEKLTEVVAKANGGVARPGQAAPASATVAPAAGTKTPAATPAIAAAAGAMPPRSATIMGMPTIKMPAGVGAAPAVSVPAPAPAKTTVMAVPPISPAPSPGGGPGLRPPAAMAAAAAAAPIAPAPATTAVGIGGMQRSPMITGIPTKRSALVERTLAKMAARLADATGLEPGSPELAALLKLSTEVVERIVWEVVPDLAEQIIRENLNELTARRS
jgi:CheY-like chemotaxis protein